MKPKTPWLAPTALVPVIVAVVSLLGTVTVALVGGSSKQKIEARVEISNEELAILARDLGFLLNQEGRYARAERVLWLALRYLPDDGDTHHSLGYALRHQENFGGAAKHFEQALELGTRDVPTPYVHSNLGAVHMELGEYEKADRHLLLAREEIEKWWLAEDLGRLRLRQDRGLEALRFFEEASRLYRVENPGKVNENLQRLIDEARREVKGE